jgi:hypothetical protein
MRAPDLHHGDADETRVSVLTGDRLCTKCGYNLVGQSVMRETHYGLLIVRCPECATVTGVQDYPTLGAWAHRWGILLAALWFLVLVGAWAGSSAITYGFSAVTAEETSRSYERYLDDRHQAELRAVKDANATANANATGNQTVDPLVQQLVAVGGTGRGRFNTWWQSQDPDALLADAGGWFGAVDWRGLWAWIPASLVLFIVGCFWSIALLQLPRRWVFAWGLGIVALGATFLTIDVVSWNQTVIVRTWFIARATIGPPIAYGTLAYLVLPFGLGAMLGRKLVRTLLRVLLPPRLSSSLAMLWTADGLSPPRRAVGRRI